VRDPPEKRTKTSKTVAQFAPSHRLRFCVSLAGHHHEQGVALEIVQEQFAHVMLFQCPQCGRPLASACASTKQNLEGADAHWFNPHCHCGWTGAVIGLTAVKHWVEAWNGAARLEPNDPGGCDGPSVNA
jgi:hypothetical protein